MTQDSWVGWRDKPEQNDFNKIFCPLCGGESVKIGNCSQKCLVCNQVVRAGCGE